MSIEDLLRETLSDMAHEEQPPPPGRFLQVRVGRSRRRGLALAAAVAVAVMAVGSTFVVEGLSSRVAVPRDVMGQGSDEALVETGRGRTTLTVGEGLRLAQVMETLSAATGRPVEEFKRAAKDGRALGLPAYAKGALEGFAFPGTYEVSSESSPGELLAAMVTRFNRAAEDGGLVDGARRAGRTPLEILTVASIVQAEAYDKRDMPKVARVIYNRLNHTPEMKLEMDSTVLYGLNKFGVRAPNEDLRSRSRYNTYARLGLPPGPIGNPGADAIEAALKPAAGPWLFFVVIDQKKSVMKFTDSESEFFKLVEEHNKNRGTGG
ncbi:endolytic transglycosylase MltG [Streptosporangium roseum]|uniref:Endolytic murein transglycosylase n=1 Tax=Streptosporangium roseum (strain ATCC 12428 / DSM 43021 / JCM 3005 / KCTC 9067 / NCIMB 10171 / NRRL 2505 / NI 9100) TaxID=479432 RepID=D2B7S8_STRRD|nr:endolytic transglycosylase MltG [Streptosporangium roseum]ACZ83859.1 periplasmic solute-binding protein-like protein [Streptosporangium roseum DSM 43021]